MTPDAAGQLERLTVTQVDPLDRARQWPQQLELLVAYDDELLRFPLMLEGATASVDVAAGRPLPNYVLPNGTGFEYGLFRLDSRSREYLVSSLPKVEDPLTRGIGWVTLWDGVLDADIAVDDWLDLLLQGLATEDVEQNTQRLLSYLATTYWKLLTDERRTALAPRVEVALWLGVTSSRTPTLKAAYFRAWRSLVLTDDLSLIHI